MDDGGGQYSTMEVDDRYSTLQLAEVVTPKETLPDRTNLPEPVSSHVDYVGETEQQGPAAPQKARGPGRRICGLTARTFWIVAIVVALIVIGAVVGGAVGGTLSASKSSSGSTGPAGDVTKSEPGPTLSMLHPSSKISATNWTDTDTARHTYFAVFSQDKYNAIMLSLYESQNRTWTAVNVSKLLAMSGQPISVKPGSSLAAAATTSSTFQMNLFFLTPSNTIGQIYSTDMTGQVWGVNQRATPTANESQLAVIWHECNYGCAQDIYVVFQDTNYSLYLLNSTDAWGTKPSLVSDRPNLGTSLAIIPFLTERGRDSPSAAELRLYFTGNSALVEYSFSSISRTWQLQGSPLVTNFNLTPAPQYAAVSFANWIKSLVVVRNADGSLAAHQWDGVKWQLNNAITLKGGPSTHTFDFICMTMHYRFYGTQSGVIHEYKWDPAAPYILMYLGPVAILDDTSS